MELQIRGVSKTYPNSVHALKNVTLTIPAGRYGLLGPNGAGKSTRMRILATLQEPDGGSVQLGDIDVLKHHLLIYGVGPRWTYSHIRSFGPSLGPWLWFKFYWAAWALLLAVAATLLWPRGTERSLWSRLQVARRRSTRAAVGVAATAGALIVILGGFIFYNTNSLNRYRTASEEAERRAEYERRSGK